ncbi:MAG: peptidoglycan editing factor PgeF [Roseburia sp.]|nr:peptidoglycan editing factor PgeF [Roseburia sp.]
MLHGLVRDVRETGPVLQVSEREGFPCLTAPLLSETGLVEHLFTTRLGGVSQGVYSSCNLSFARGDREEHVRENYRRVARGLCCRPEDIVATKQTHTTNIRRVTMADKGKGVVRLADYDNVDGLMTDIPGIALAAFTADCVPVCFVDTVNRAIGVVHSGWRGTVGQISCRLLQEMEEAYGSRPQDMTVAIGPSICRDCYEVSEDVADTFRKLLEGTEPIRREIAASGVYYCGPDGRRGVVEAGREPGKYQLDLWLANLILLRRAGVSLSRIAVTDVCTCHNPELLFSHRASRGKRGNLGAFIMLKEKE